MKWFKHETNAHSNLKLQGLLNTFGLKGYGYYWACIELVGLQGENCCITAEKEWQTYLKKQLDISLDEQKDILLFLATKSLIDLKALKRGALSIPKLAERSDDYTNKVRRKSVHSPDKVALEQKRTEENRIEQIRQFDLFWVEYPRKEAKATAHKSWEKIWPTPELFQVILDALKKHKETDQWKKSKEYIPHPATWLNQKRWEDEIVPGVNKLLDFKRE